MNCGFIHLEGTLEIVYIYTRRLKLRYVFGLLDSAYSKYSCDSECGPQTGSISTIWELVRNAEPQASSPTKSESAFQQDPHVICMHVSLRRYCIGKSTPDFCPTI